ncbi:hypothetical protein F9C11_20440 [Amycolatopsis sp. VS8301801F10]|uniref:hypothetical protein n=1 Tax=unclassified Amycolatopsis TaxID=2618356 RepID=UPI0038FC1759
MTWIYESFETGLWTVGFYRPDGSFAPATDHRSEEEAAQRVHYLNGGREGSPDHG